MKRLFPLILFVAASLAFSPAHSQQTMTNSVDTLTNAVTAYSTFQVLAPADLLTIQLVVTKISGTVAGTSIPQGSIDGINFADISTDTFTLTNIATNTKLWTFVKSPYKYYRLKTATTGTQVSSQSNKIFTRQPPK